MANKTIEKYNQIVGNTIAKAIEGHPNWQSMIANNEAVNVSSEPSRYKGVNAINLAITAANRGDNDNRYMTRIQAKEAGMSIKDGAKAVAISYLSPQDKQVTDKAGVSKTIKVPFMRVGYVYNAKDIEGIAPRNQDTMLKTGDRLLSKATYKVVMQGKKAYFDKTKKAIVLPKGLSDDALTSTYAVVASKTAVEQNYLNDSKDVQAFKSQMAAVLITKQAGAKFEPVGVEKQHDFNTDFLRDAKVGMKALRSTAKIANFVQEGKELGLTKSQTKPANPKTAASKTQGPKAKALKKRKAKTNERGGLSR